MNAYEEEVQAQDDPKPGDAVKYKGKWVTVVKVKKGKYKIRLSATEKIEVSRRELTTLGPKQIDQEWVDQSIKIAKEKFGTEFKLAEPFTVLCVGGAGQGKSSLVQALTEQVWRNGITVKNFSADGVTKEMSPFRMRPEIVPGCFIYDSSGVGDGTVSTEQLLYNIKQVFGERVIHCVIICMAIDAARFTLDAQIICGIVSRGFVKSFDNVILLGTKADTWLVDPDDDSDEEDSDNDNEDQYDARDKKEWYDNVQEHVIEKMFKKQDANASPHVCHSWVNMKKKEWDKKENYCVGHDLGCLVEKLQEIYKAGKKALYEDDGDIDGILSNIGINLNFDAKKKKEIKRVLASLREGWEKKKLKDEELMEYIKGDLEKCMNSKKESAQIHAVIRRALDKYMRRFGASGEDLKKVLKEVDKMRDAEQLKIKQELDKERRQTLENFQRDQKKAIDMQEEMLAKEKKRQDQQDAAINALQQNRDHNKKQNMKRGPKSPAIGIDLGTTFCCVGIYRNGKVEIIPNQLNSKNITPSYVGFFKDERHMGESAYQKRTYNRYNTVYGVKRLIGRRFGDRVVEQDANIWPFHLKEGNDKRILIEVDFEGKKQSFKPEQISAMLLEQLKKEAEAYLGEEVKQAVITVPAYFNNAQRKATKDAGKIAGLDVLRVMNEPTAAALAYSYNKPDDRERNVLVFDLGGGTFDVCIMTIRGNVYQTRAVNGDTHLGGEDFDNLLLKNTLKRLTFAVPKEDLAQVGKLRDICVLIKHKLSNSTREQAGVEVTIDGKTIDAHVDVRRKKFENLCAESFEKCMKLTEETLKDADLTAESINEIILVGGSTKIPKIEQMLKERFGDKIRKSINAETAVAEGAAIAAASLSGSMKQIIAWNDVVPLTMGVEVRNKSLSVLVKRNSPIPFTWEKPHYTVKDNQESACFPVYEGEDLKVARNNHFLGEFTLTGIKPGSAGQQLNVKFHVNKDSILEVTATEERNKYNNKTLKIELDKYGLQPNEIKQMIDERDSYNARKDFREYLDDVEDDHSKLKLFCLVQRQWLRDNSHVDASKIRRKLKDIKKQVASKTNGGGRRYD